MTFPVAEVRDHESLAAAFAEIKNFLGLSNEACDDLAGFCKGATDKYLGPSAHKRIGPVTFDIFCSLFAVKFVPVVDVEAAKKMERRYEQRQTQQVRPPARVSKSLLDRALRHLAREFSWAEILATIGRARADVAAEAKAEAKQCSSNATARPERKAVADCATAQNAGRDPRGSKRGGLRYVRPTARARIKAMQSAYLARAKAAAAPQI